MPFMRRTGKASGTTVLLRFASRCVTIRPTEIPLLTTPQKARFSRKLYPACYQTARGSPTAWFPNRYIFQSEALLRIAPPALGRAELPPTKWLPPGNLELVARAGSSLRLVAFIRTGLRRLPELPRLLPLEIVYHLVGRDDRVFRTLIEASEEVHFIP